MAIIGKEKKNKLKAALLGVPCKELVSLVLGLCSISEDNQSFVEARFAITQDPLLPYKQRIEDALYPDIYSNKPIQIAAARKAITEYKQASGNPEGLLELMIYYVECATAFTAEFGDINESFYSSVESMYDRFLTALEKVDPSAKESFRSRAQAVVDLADGIGWGFYDYLVQRFAEAYKDMG